MILTVNAPAKINLHLHVTGKRPDGYHELDSLICFADIGDQISFEAAPTLQLDVSGEFSHLLTGKDLSVSRDSNNSVIRAVWLMADRIGLEPKVRISLIKNLPTGSGIGGGSADAAATLKSLAQFWDAPISLDELLFLAEKIGSDVPACIKSRPVIMQGIGEKIFTAPVLPKMPAVLIWPDQHTSTPLVYKNFQTDLFSPCISFERRYESVNHLTEDLKSRTANDLELAAIKLFPCIGQAGDILDKSNGCLLSRMSGSGSTIFGLFETENQAVTASKYIAQAHPNWWVKSCLINNE